jgi:UDP-glucose 4-epimerase
MKTIIVFGASGTLGTYFVDALHEAGYKVWAVSRRNIVEDYYTSRGIRSASVDITNPKDFDQLPSEGIDAVVQIAGAMPSRMAGYKPELYLQVNTLGTLNVLEYCRRAKVKTHIFTQSHSDVAGHWNTGEIIPPDAPRILNLKGDHAVYIISKNAAVDLIEHYHLDYGLRTLVFRLPTIYNYRPIFDMYVDGKSRPMGFMFFIQQAMESKPIEIWGDPSRAKDIVYVKDFNQMLIGGIESSVPKGIYNVASGVATSLEEQIRGVIEVFSPADKPSEILYRPEMPSQNSYLYDIGNARRDLGYNPQYQYLDLLRDMKQEMKGGRFAHLSGSDVTI